MNMEDKNLTDLTTDVPDGCLGPLQAELQKAPKVTATSSNYWGGIEQLRPYADLLTCLSIVQNTFVFGNLYYLMPFPYDSFLEIDAVDIRGLWLHVTFHICMLCVPLFSSDCVYTLACFTMLFWSIERCQRMTAWNVKSRHLQKLTNYGQSIPHPLLPWPQTFSEIMVGSCCFCLCESCDPYLFS